jgi:hypothetical protein
VYHKVFVNGLNAAFVIHVQEALNFCKRKGYYIAYKNSKAQLVECFPRMTAAQKKLDDSKADPTTPKERHKLLKRSPVLAKLLL